VREMRNEWVDILQSASLSIHLTLLFSSLRDSFPIFIFIFRFFSFSLAFYAPLPLLALRPGLLLLLLLLHPKDGKGEDKKERLQKPYLTTSTKLTPTLIE
jgi:hypothetical protein